MPKQLELLKRIEQHYNELPPSSQKLAQFLQQNPLELLTKSATEIADQCEVSKATLSRFFRQLGYESHELLKKEIRRYGQPILTQENTDQHLGQQIQALQQTWDQLDNSLVAEIAEVVASKKQITIIGFRNSYPLAMHLQQQLLHVRKNVRLLPLPGQTISEELTDDEADNFYIVIGMRRRPKLFSKLIDGLKNESCLLITDQTGQGYRSAVSHFIMCHLSEEQALDDYVSPMSIIARLCNEVYLEKNSQAQQRSSKIALKFKDLSELE